MTSNNTSQNGNKPVWRLAFAPHTGTDGNGQPTIGYPVEIGAVFARRDAEKGLIAKFRIIPADLKDGVLLLTPVRSQADMLPGMDEAAR